MEVFDHVIITLKNLYAHSEIRSIPLLLYLFSIKKPLYTTSHYVSWTLLMQTNIQDERSFVYDLALVEANFSLRKHGNPNKINGNSYTLRARRKKHPLELSPSQNIVSSLVVVWESCTTFTKAEESSSSVSSWVLHILFPSLFCHSICFSASKNISPCKTLAKVLVLPSAVRSQPAHHMTRHISSQSESSPRAQLC